MTKKIRYRIPVEVKSDTSIPPNNDVTVNSGFDALPVFFDNM